MPYVKGLFLNDREGYGEIRLPEWFIQSDPLYKLDMIQGWIGELEELYSISMEEWRKQGKAFKKGLTGSNISSIPADVNKEN